MIIPRAITSSPYSWNRVHSGNKKQVVVQFCSVYFGASTKQFGRMPKVKEALSVKLRQWIKDYDCYSTDGKVTGCYPRGEQEGFLPPLTIPTSPPGQRD